MFKVGKLYICEEFFLLLYPDQEACAVLDAARATAVLHHVAEVAEASAAAHATYWTKKLGKSVLYAKKNIPILVLNSKEKFQEVLAGDRKGWIIVEDWLGIKEIINENIS